MSLWVPRHLWSTIIVTLGFLHSEKFPKFSHFLHVSGMDTKLLTFKIEDCKQQLLEDFKKFSAHPKNKPK
jgi:hypothetical protein